MKTFILKEESLAIRCEVCHQSDQFNPKKNYCKRCGIIAELPKLALPLRVEISQHKIDPMAEALLILPIAFSFFFIFIYLYCNIHTEYKPSVCPIAANSTTNASATQLCCVGDDNPSKRDYFNRAEFERSTKQNGIDAIQPKTGPKRALLNFQKFLIEFSGLHFKKPKEIFPDPKDFMAEDAIQFFSDNQTVMIMAYKYSNKENLDEGAKSLKKFVDSGGYTQMIIVDKYILLLDDQVFWGEWKKKGDLGKVLA